VHDSDSKLFQLRLHSVEELNQIQKPIAASACSYAPASVLGKAPLDLGALSTALRLVVLVLVTLRQRVVAWRTRTVEALLLS